MSKKKNNLNYIPASAKTAAQRKDEAKQNKRANLSPEMRAKLLKKRAWTLSVVSLCFVLVLTLSILFASYTPTYYSEKTNSAPESTIDSGIIANEQFNLSSLLYNGEVTSALQQPYLPSDWTVSNKTAGKSVAGIISRDANNNTKVKGDLNAVGITNTDDINAILENSDATSDTADKNVLLMYNKSATDARAYSNSFTVDANSYLEIKVRVRTSIASGDGAFISIKTSASDSADAEVSFTGVNHSDWKEYTFYIEGSKTSSKTLYLFVGLGTNSSAVKGWAEFDYAIAKNAKKVDYIKTVKENSDSTIIKTKSYVNDLNDEDLFEDTSVWSNSTVPSMQNATPHVGEVSGKYELPFYNNTSLKVYEISNTASSSSNSVFMQLTEKLQISKSTASPYYRLSFWAKTSDIKLETGAYFYVRLYKQDDSNGTEFVSLNRVSTSEKADDTNSGWEEFSFLFKPDNNARYEAEIVFSLGALVYSNGEYKPAITDVKTTGSLFVTEFELKEIYPSEYDNATAGDNLAKVALTNSTSTGLITNGSFDSPVSNATSNLDPFDPNGWNILVPSKNTADGFKYAPHSTEDLMFGILSKNPGSNDWTNHTGGDNILAVSVFNPTAIGFASNSFTIPANSIYVVSVLVKTSGDANANVYLTGDLEQSFKVESIAPEKYYSWQEFSINDGYTKYNFVIKTGDVAKQVALELWVGDKDVTYSNGAWDTTKFAQAGSMVAFDEATANSISDVQFRDIVNSKEDGTNVFVKTETEGFIKDENGNDTTEKEVVDVKYSTTKANIKVTDLSYADNTGAIETDEEETETEEQVAPIDWLLFSSLILSIAVIIFLVAVICKKFAKAQKHVEVVEDPDYKN